MNRYNEISVDEGWVCWVCPGSQYEVLMVERDLFCERAGLLHRRHRLRQHMPIPTHVPIQLTTMPSQYSWMCRYGTLHATYIPNSTIRIKPMEIWMYVMQFVSIWNKVWLQVERDGWPAGRQKQKGPQHQTLKHTHRIHTSGYNSNAYTRAASTSISIHTCIRIMLTHIIITFTSHQDLDLYHITFRHPNCSMYNVAIRVHTFGISVWVAHRRSALTHTTRHTHKSSNRTRSDTQSIHISHTMQAHIDHIPHRSDNTCTHGSIHWSIRIIEEHDDGIHVMPATWVFGDVSRVTWVRATTRDEWCRTQNTSSAPDIHHDMI